MHEFALAQSILAAIEENTKQNLSNLTAIHLDVGQFAGIVTDSLEFGLNVALADINLEDVKINMTHVPATALCECGFQYHIKDIFEHCPMCQSFQREITSGTDVIISSIELAD